MGGVELEHVRLGGVDTHPGGEQLKHYWLTGEGAGKWKTWTELEHHLMKYMSPGKAKRTAAAWFHERYGFWPGDKRNRSDANGSTYGELAFTADPWINARAQEVLTRGGLPPLPPLPGETEPASENESDDSGNDPDASGILTDQEGE